MKLSPPRVLTYIIAVVLAILSALSWFVSIPLISAHPFYVLVIAFIVLVLGNLFKGL